LYGTPYPLEDQRLIVNPGGVGQPRDGDPRAAYAVYDSDDETVTHFRVEYDIVLTQQKMRSYGLPEFLIERLAVGH
jgi:diadenosine tetraphosphatase ApaH/serine/threonine PP2A family protein phosphatase